MEDTRTKKWLALLLSFIIPGVGQIYNKQWKKTIIIWALFFIGVLIYSLTESDLLAILAALFLFVVWVYQLYDAYKEAK